MKFRVGDTVAWTSQAGGHSKTKTGVVAAIVPATEDPRNHGDAPEGCGMCRDHESYLVRVGKQQRCYWPRVSTLFPVKPDDVLRQLWRDAGGEFHGPHVETGYMPEAKLLPFLRKLLTAR